MSSAGAVHDGSSSRVSLLQAKRSSESTRPAVRTSWILGGMILLGAVIRFTTLGEQSFWVDEGFTYQIVSHGLGHALSTIPKTESTPPLYYVLVWAWSRVFGVREAGLRSFSAICGTLTIPVVWAIGRRMVSERVGLIAAALTTISPLLFWYSQEARSYALLVLLSALSLLLLVSVLARPTNRRIVGWGTICALALCTHYFAVFVIVPQAVWLLAALRRDGQLSWAKAALGLGPIVLIGAALMPLAIAQYPNGRTAWIARSGSLLQRLLGFAEQQVIGYGSSTKGLVAICGLVLAAIGLGLLRHADRRQLSALALPLTVGTIGVVIPFVIAVLGKDDFDTRNLLATWPAFAIVVATGYGAARGRAAMLALGTLAAISIFCVVRIVAEPALQRANWRGVARALGPASGRRAIVSAELAAASLAPYMSGLAHYPATSTQIEEIDVVSVAGQWGGAALEHVVVPLPGFSVVQRSRTSTYQVLRYRVRAGAPALEPSYSLARLMPNYPTPLVLIQSP
jgi:mannosyltransferase